MAVRGGTENSGKIFEGSGGCKVEGIKLANNNNGDPIQNKKRKLGENDQEEKTPVFEKISNESSPEKSFSGKKMGTALNLVEHHLTDLLWGEDLFVLNMLDKPGNRKKEILFIRSIISIFKIFLKLLAI